MFFLKLFPNFTYEVQLWCLVAYLNDKNIISLITPKEIKEDKFQIGKLPLSTLFYIFKFLNGSI